MASPIQVRPGAQGPRTAHSDAAARLPIQLMFFFGKEHELPELRYTAADTGLPHSLVDFHAYRFQASIILTPLDARSQERMNQLPT